MPKCLSNVQPLWCPEPCSSEYVHYKHNGYHNEWIWTVWHSRLDCHRPEYIYRVRRISYRNKQISRSRTDAGSCPRLWANLWPCHGACWGLWGFHAPLVNTSNVDLMHHTHVLTSASQRRLSFAWTHRRRRSLFRFSTAQLCSIIIFTTFACIHSLLSIAWR